MQEQENEQQPKNEQLTELTLVEVLQELLSNPTVLKDKIQQSLLIQDSDEISLGWNDITINNENIQDILKQLVDSLDEREESLITNIADQPEFESVQHQLQLVIKQSLPEDPSLFENVATTLAISSYLKKTLDLEWIDKTVMINNEGDDIDLLSSQFDSFYLKIEQDQIILILIQFPKQIDFPTVEEIHQQSEIPLSSHRSEIHVKDKTRKRFEPNANGPPKYLNRRQPPEEIPPEIVHKLFLLIDTDKDDRISIDELMEYSRAHRFNWSDEEFFNMFKEASKNRNIVHQKQRDLPLTFEEVYNNMKGRFRWNIGEKEWSCFYRPYRDNWILLLKTISSKIFALAPEALDVGPILAQFEQKEFETKHKVHKSMYSSIKHPKEQIFGRQINKPEGGIIPEGSISFIKDKENIPKYHPYEQQINSRIKEEEFPKITFEAQELFQQAEKLSKEKQYWETESENPIFNFVPKTIRAVTAQPLTGPRSTRCDSNKGMTPMTGHRTPGQITPFGGVSEIDNRTGRSRGDFEKRQEYVKNRMAKPPVSVTNFVKGQSNPASGQTVIKRPKRKQKDFKRSFYINNISSDKQKFARSAKTQINEEGKQVYIQDEYVVQKVQKFRDDILDIGQVDFKNRIRCPMPYNPFHIQELEKLPIEAQKRLRKQEEQFRKEQDDLYNDKTKNKDWKQYFHYNNLPNSLQPISGHFPDIYQVKGKIHSNKALFLEKEEYTTEVLQLARQQRDDVVYGKPNFNKYFKTLLPADLNDEFGEIRTRPFKCINI